MAASASRSVAAPMLFRDVMNRMRFGISVRDSSTEAAFVGIELGRCREDGMIRLPVAKQHLTLHSGAP